MTALTNDQDATTMAAEQITRTLLHPYFNHAVRMLEDGYATATDIDNAMRFGCGYAKGPLAMLDEWGPAAVRDELAGRFAESGDRLHQPADLLERVAAEGGVFVTGAAAGVAVPELRRPIRKVGVVGTGTMAGGIVQVFAQAGYDVVCVGRSRERVEAVAAGITKNLDRAIAKGRSDEATRAAVLGRLTGTVDRSDLAEVDLVVEAVAEDLAVKTRLFGELDRILKRGAILATTTSSLSITELAAATSRPEDVIGMHFFNPAQVMKLVEVVTTPSTAVEVAETVKALCTKVEKVAVSCADRPGFIVNCLLFPYLNDAVKLNERGVAMTEIDAAVKDRAGFPMGPFELLDVVGLDVSLAICEELFREFGEPGLAPAPGLEERVAAGDLGRKTGAGFHDYH